MYSINTALNGPYFNDLSLWSESSYGCWCRFWCQKRSKRVVSILL